MARKTTFSRLELDRVPPERKFPVLPVLKILAGMVALALAGLALAVSVGSLPILILTPPWNIAGIIGSVLFASASVGVIAKGVQEAVEHDDRQKLFERQREGYIRNHPLGKVGYQQDLTQQKKANRMIKAVEKAVVKDLTAAKYLSKDNTKKFRKNEGFIRELVDKAAIELLTRERGTGGAIDQKAFETLSKYGTQRLSQEISNNIRSDSKITRTLNNTVVAYKPILGISSYLDFYKEHFSGRTLEEVLASPKPTVPLLELVATKEVVKGKADKGKGKGKEKEVDTGKFDVGSYVSQLTQESPKPSARQEYLARRESDTKEVTKKDANNQEFDIDAVLSRLSSHPSSRKVSDTVKTADVKEAGKESSSEEEVVEPISYVPPETPEASPKVPHKQELDQSLYSSAVEYTGQHSPQASPKHSLRVSPQASPQREVLTEYERDSDSGTEEESAPLQAPQQRATSHVAQLQASRSSAPTERSSRAQQVSSSKP